MIKEFDKNFELRKAKKKSCAKKKYIFAAIF